MTKKITSAKNKTTFDRYQVATDIIVEALEAGRIPWIRPWKKGAEKAQDLQIPHNAVSGRPYTGLNVLLLQAVGFNYPTQQYLTGNQVKQLGGTIPRENYTKGHFIIFFNIIKREDEDGNKSTFPILKHFYVYNLAQVEGVDESKFPAIEREVLTTTDMTKIAGLHNIDLRYGGDKAFFSPSRDFIQMPEQSKFEDANTFDETLGHEMTHWTGHKDRLGREFGKRFGDHAYAFEELVAEMGSAFLAVQLDRPLRTLQHAAYLNSWINVLKTDKKAILTAASSARKACELLIEPIKAELEEELPLEKSA